LSKARVVKALCLGAAVTALVWLAVGCSGSGGSVIPGTQAPALDSYMGSNSDAYDIYVDPAAGVATIIDDKMVSEHVVPAGDNNVKLEALVPTPADQGRLDSRTGNVTVWMNVKNYMKVSAGDIMLVPGNYVGRSAGDRPTNAVIPNVLNLQPFGLANNDIVPQFGNQPIQGDGFTRRSITDPARIVYYFEGEAPRKWQPEREVGDPAFSPRDDPYFWGEAGDPQTCYGLDIFQGCFQLVPNPAYRRSEDTGAQRVPDPDNPGMFLGDGEPFDPRLSPYNVDDFGNPESIARPCSGQKLTVPNCISALYIGQLQGSEDLPGPTETPAKFLIRDPIGLAFAFQVRLWASWWTDQRVWAFSNVRDVDGVSVSPNYNLNGVSARDVYTCFAVGEQGNRIGNTSTPGDGDAVIIATYDGGQTWTREACRSDTGQQERKNNNLNRIWINKTRRVGGFNPVSGVIEPGTALPSKLQEEGKFGVAVGVQKAAGGPVIYRTLGGTNWLLAPDQKLPTQTQGFSSAQGLNAVAAAVENGYGGALGVPSDLSDPNTLTDPSSVYIAVGDARDKDAAGGIIVSIDGGDTWHRSGPNQHGDRTRDEGATRQRYSNFGINVQKGKNLLAVCADQKPSGVRIGEVHWSWANTQAYIGSLALGDGTDPVLDGYWATPAISANRWNGLMCESWTRVGYLGNPANPRYGQLANNYRVFVAGVGGQILFSDDCITPCYTPQAGSAPGDEMPQNLPTGWLGVANPRVPQAPIPLSVTDSPGENDGWQTTWEVAEGSQPDDVVLDLACCEVPDAAEDYGTRMVVLAVTELGRLLYTTDGRAPGSYGISVILDDNPTSPTNPWDATVGITRRAAGSKVMFTQDTSVQANVGFAPQATRPGPLSQVDLRAVSCNPWELCPQALNDNDRWYPAAAGTALQVWVVGQQTDLTGYTYNGKQQPIVLHNPAFDASPPPGGAIPIGAIPGTYNAGTGLWDNQTTTVDALVVMVGQGRDDFNAPQQQGWPSDYKGWWYIQNPRANVWDPTWDPDTSGPPATEYAADLNDVDCVNPLGVKQEFQRAVVPGFPADKNPVPEPTFPSSPITTPAPCGPFNPTEIPVEEPGTMDGYVVVIVPDVNAPLLWPSAWAVGGLPGPNQDNGAPGFAVYDNAFPPKDPGNPAGIAVFGDPGFKAAHPLPHNAAYSVGVIRNYF